MRGWFHHEGKNNDSKDEDTFLEKVHQQKGQGATEHYQETISTQWPTFLDNREHIKCYIGSILKLICCTEWN